MNTIFSCIVITCRTLSSVISTEKEIELLKKKNRIPECVTVLTIEDPAKDLGSGAATLNALLVAAEHLSAKQGLMVLSSDVLLDAHILILHNGRDYLYSCSGKAFIPIPVEYVPKDKAKLYAGGVMSNLEATLLLIEKLSHESPFGVWVCSTDMMILQDNTNNSISWSKIADAVMYCVPSDLQYATGHGVVSLDKEGLISNIYYCGLVEQIKDFSTGDGKVPLVSGIVFLKAHVAESLLSLHIQTPLNSCTYLGLDSGNKPIQVSLFFDLLLAMTTDMKKETFVSGKCGKSYNTKFGIPSESSNEGILARTYVWEELSAYKLSPIILSGCQHLYWSNQDSADYYASNLFKIASSDKVHATCKATKSPTAFDDCLIMNSSIKVESCNLASKVIISDSDIEAYDFSVGKNSMLSGMIFSDNQAVLNIPDDLCVLNTFFENCSTNGITVMFGMKENPFVTVNLSEGTFCNKPWSQVLSRLKINVWNSNLDLGKRTLMNARLFSCCLSLKETLTLFLCEDNKNSGEILKKWENSPRYSLEEILENINYVEVLNQRRQRFAVVSCQIVEDALVNNKDIYLLPYFQASYVEQWSHSLLHTLDKVLLSGAYSTIKTRTLSCTADLLSIMAGVNGGLRSGPGSNQVWSKAFQLLLNGESEVGMKALIEERSNWLGRPDHLMRAARHYERAAQILIQNSMKTVRQDKLLTAAHPGLGVVVTAECPARIDLQGGWSDTPPICYELGGSVVNIAILIDGKRPIGAQACRILQPHIKLQISLNDMSQEVLIKDKTDISDYDQPNSKGSLLKAALICAEVVDVNSTSSLKEQLLSKFGCGFEIHSWSSLPQGCGMGTSSILAGAIVSVLWSVTGRVFDKSSIIHAVLFVEQLLTTGGGWQDQVSGVMGGINRGYSEATLPLCVKVEQLTVEDGILEKLNSHLLLIYTGKVRLAKNLLQNVIRNWYAREENVVKCFKDLITHSFEMKTALLQGNLSEIGNLMDKYWEQKKILAPGCEPSSVRELMDLLKPLCFGQLLLGAGGGGFMCVLTKQRNCKQIVEDTLQKYKENRKLSVYSVTIDLKGLEIFT